MHPLALEAWHVALALTFVVGFAVLLYGFWADQWRQRRRAAEVASPPRRRIPGLAGGEPPRYVSAEQARTRVARAPLSEDVGQRVATLLNTGDSLPVGLPAPEFVTDEAAGRTVLLEPVVLLTDAAITDLWMLLPVLEHAARGRHPVVVAAASFAPEVLTTLVVNSLRGTLDVIALEVDAPQRAAIGRQIGGEALTAADLQSGHPPPSDLPRTALWVSTPERSWIAAQA